MRSLTEINREYENIMAAGLKPHDRAVKLAELMTDMEGRFRIPMLKNPEWEKENKKVIAMYRKISISRRENL